MQNVLGIVFAYDSREKLRELTKRRTLASLPIAGKYRIIDFVLSGFVNAEIYEVSVITNNNSHSLVDHIASGKEWDLTRKKGGLRILSPLSHSGDMDISLYRGSADALARNKNSINRSMAEYVIMTGSSIICCNLDYKELMNRHIQSGADITAVYSRSMNGGKIVPIEVPIFNIDEDDKILGMHINKNDMIEQEAAWSVGTFIIKKSLLEALVAEAESCGRYHFYEDIIGRLAGSLYIKGYEYNGQLFDISTISGYMQANMNFLKDSFREKAFEKPIYTKVKDSVPAQYMEGCNVTHSLISDGCYIEGIVENSIISRGVRIKKGAVVKNCIVMQNTEILQNVTLDHVILDKDVIVRENRMLTGQESYPVVVEKGSIV